MEFNEEDGELSEPTRTTHPNLPYADLLDSFEEDSTTNVSVDFADGGANEVKPAS